MTTADMLREPHAIALPPPVVDESTPLMQALRLRRSVRAFGAKALSDVVLSTLLWAGFGVNRPESGKRTAPSAHNWQEIDVYAALASGTYQYEPAGHRLVLAVPDDLRALTGTQEFVATAPLNLVYVADFARMDAENGNDRAFLAGADAAVIAQNVYLYAAAAGLATVVRGLIDRRALARAMGLRPQQRIVLAQSVGYPVL
ncbi:MAG TPA: SagB/ThcOx family dehydrogenase [Casimicrobiaceae bacterium]|nr:SagB/ThcOx family dehydrogenase [Casimicrobiaceae bacterium]